MLPTEVTAPAGGNASQGDQDLGPLAWVLDELRKSLDSAVKATRRFVREAQEVRDSDLAALDGSPLRMAKQQLHQACGALEMVGMPQVALLLRAMETAVQHYVQTPRDCTEAVALTLEKSSFAVLEFLEAVLAGKRISAVSLFPQYRDIQALYGNEGKVHPADLWPIERRLRDPDLPRQVPALGYAPEQRKILDIAVLQIVKGQHIAAASARVCEVCLGFAQAQSEMPMRIFWKVAAAYFDAMAHGLLNADIYAKRMASRVLMVCAALAKGEPVAPERLLQDMLFFCAQAGTGAEAAKNATIWQAVYASFGLQRHAVADYERAHFGRFDPAVLTQARKRIATATEIWSTLAGGDVNKIKPAVDQFTLVCDSLAKLHPESHVLAKALMQVMHSVAAKGQPPSTEVAMEVATSVLYLQAAFASLDIADSAMSLHGETLANRLTSVLAGHASQPLAPWMEQLYRQVSDQQTMGSVLGELRGTLGGAEKLLDQYFRNPADTTLLAPVASHLSQMRGVLSVLGLEPASLAMVHMRQNVERLQSEDVPEAEQQVLFEKMGNSLGALGFLIDMLSYQRNMARKLYEFDEKEGELKLLMGRVRV
ncbi:MAG: hybrid sensor histidine kinase/response regulator, partial [Comamonas sp.]